MPRGGIIVIVTFPSVAGRFEPLRLVLPRRPTALLEGTTDTREYRIAGRIRGVNVLIFVDIRNPHPTAVERRVAQRVVSSLRFS
jgi:hypothetical protein